MQTVGQLALPREVWDQILEHVRAAVPDEAVGMLGGTADGRVSHAVPLPNLATGGAFLADPRAQFEAERAFARLNVTPLAAYHSHPGGTPTLSSGDRAFARPALIQLVVSLGRQGAVDARAYRVADVVTELPLWIENVTWNGERASST